MTKLPSILAFLFVMIGAQLAMHCRRITTLPDIRCNEAESQCVEFNPLVNAEAPRPEYYEWIDSLSGCSRNFEGHIIMNCQWLIQTGMGTELCILDTGVVCSEWCEACTYWNGKEWIKTNGWIR